MSPTECRICSGSLIGGSYRVAETMFRMGEVFEYFRCAACGCAQIGEFPADLGRYYPQNYFSFAEPRRGVLPNIGRALRSVRDLAYAGGLRSLVGTPLAAIAPSPSLRAIAMVAGPETAILDIGCGYGRTLLQLWRLGYRDLLGVDAFLASDITHDCGVRILRASIDALPQGRWGAILLSHILEHVPDQFGALSAVRARLAPGGSCIVRIPVADSRPYGTYGPDWVGHDAPRHLFLHTQRSLAIAAAKTGLTVQWVYHDATYFQYWGSELCRRGVPWAQGFCIQNGSLLRHFSLMELAGFALEAQRRNRAGDGGTAVFCLRRTVDG